MNRFYILLFFLIFFLSQISYAQWHAFDPTEEDQEQNSTQNKSQFYGIFLDWSLFTIAQGDRKICYIISLPVEKQGDYNQRGEAYFIVTTIDDDEEIIVSSGYNYQNESDVILSFGLKKYDLFTYKNLAWTDTKDDDIEIIKDMKRGVSVVVSGTAIDRSYSQDLYSLVGFNKAYTKMKFICRNDN